MLWLSIYLPQLPLEVFTRGANSGASISNNNNSNNSSEIIIIEKHRVLQASAKARAQGVQIASAHASAIALAPNANCLERDKQREYVCLQALAQWCYQFTPAVVINKPASLLLEIGACLKLFHGLPKLMQRIRSGLREQGYTHRCGLAATATGAQLLAFDDNYTISDSGQTGYNANENNMQAQLADVPLSHLQQPPKIIRKLHSLGLRTLGELLDLPRAAIGKRFGIELQTYLQKITGERHDPQHFIEPDVDFYSQLYFLEPIHNSQMLLFPMQRLLNEYCQFLHSRQLHCQSFHWQLHTVKADHNPRISIELSQAQADKDNFLKLTRIKMENLRLDEGVHTLALEADRFVPFSSETASLFADHSNNISGKNADLGLLLDKLKARLGEQQVYRLDRCAEHLPEYDTRIKPLLSEKTAAPALTQEYSPQKTRPGWLLPQTVPLQQRPQGLYWRGYLQLRQGPERIETLWWQETARRDYYIAQHDNGELYWIFHDLNRKRWFVQGLF